MGGTDLDFQTLVMILLCQRNVAVPESLVLFVIPAIPFQNETVQILIGLLQGCGVQVPAFRFEFEVTWKAFNGESTHNRRVMTKHRWRSPLTDDLLVLSYPEGLQDVGQVDDFRMHAIVAFCNMGYGVRVFPGQSRTKGEAMAWVLEPEY